MQYMQSWDESLSSFGHCEYPKVEETVKKVYSCDDQEMMTPKELLHMTVVDCGARLSTEFDSQRIVLERKPESLKNNSTMPVDKRDSKPLVFRLKDSEGQVYNGQSSVDAFYQKIQPRLVEHEAVVRVHMLKEYSAINFIFGRSLFVIENLHTQSLKTVHKRRILAFAKTLLRNEAKQDISSRMALTNLSKLLDGFRGIKTLAPRMTSVSRPPTPPNGLRNTQSAIMGQA